MVPWWFWLVLSGCWLVTGILNAVNGRSPIALVLYFLTAIFFAVLSILKRKKQ